jgi:Retroviral aspartyl protease.
MDVIKKPFTIIIAGGVARPILPVIISNPTTCQELRTFALIDTGADDCAFPASYALLTGHNLLAGNQKEIGTGNGKTNAYAHTVSLEINGYKIDNILIDFMPNLHIGLLGVQNFLKRFILTIDYPGQNFSLKG